MNRNLILLFVIVTHISCVTNQSEKKEVFVIAPAITTLQDTVTENILITQLNEYLEAYKDGDLEKVLYFLYPGIFEYMEKNFNGITQAQAEEALVAPIRELRTQMTKNKMIMRFEVGEIVARVNQNDNLLYKIVYRTKTENGYDELTFGNEILAISVDNGTNWKFMEWNKEESPKVLQMKFSQATINRLIKN